MYQECRSGLYLQTNKMCAHVSKLDYDLNYEKAHCLVLFSAPVHLELTQSLGCRHFQAQVF